MARIRNGILGGFSNKVGEVIGQNYAGVSTMRAMPKYVTNPRTPAQEAHRAKVALLGEFLRPLKLVTNLSSWGGNAVYNCYNKAFKANFANLSYADGNAKFVDYQSINLGKYFGETFPNMEVLFDFDVPADFCSVSLGWSNELFSPFCSDLDRPIFFMLHELAVDKYELVFADLLECQRSWGSYKFIFYLPDKYSLYDRFSYCFAYTSYDIEAISPNKVKRDINWDYYYQKLRNRYTNPRDSARILSSTNRPQFNELLYLRSN